MNEASGIEVAGKPPDVPPHFKMLMVGMDMQTGGIRIEKDDKLVPSWEMVVAILSAALAVANFNRNMGHGAMIQAQQQRMMEEENIKAAIRQKGKVHV